MKPIFCHHHLDFVKRDFAVCVADTLREAGQYAGKKLGVNLDCDKEDEKATAICIIKKNGATALLFARKYLDAATICHEVTHATNGMFEHIGIELNRGSDEAFAYHNDMLFRTVAELLKKHKISIPLFK